MGIAHRARSVALTGSMEGMSQTTPPRTAPVVDPEHAHAALANAAEQLKPVRAAMEQFARAYMQNLSRVMEAFRPLIEHAQAHPEVLEQWRREREAEEQLGSCHCLCQASHGSVGVCTSVAEPGLTVTFESPTVGTQRVPYCRACHAARVEFLASPPVTEAVTDTCACHCFANHPGTPGVCEAASDPGVALDGRPACRGCRDAAQEGATP